MGMKDQIDKIDPIIDECQGFIEGEYDLPLHIGSIFILFGISLGGALLPILGQSYFSVMDSKRITA